MARLRHFLRERKGAAAVEFALAGSAFILSTLFIMVVGMIFYVGEMVDYATNAAARDILTGTAQANAATLGTFTDSLCKRLPAALPCGNLIVNLYVVPEATQPAGYYAFVKPDQSGLLIPNLTPGSGQFTLGKRGEYQYLLVIYPITALPSAFATMLGGGATFNGKPAFLATATAAFRNELF
jgi:Flp pilus assembly pilin Flp